MRTCLSILALLLATSTLAASSSNLKTTSNGALVEGFRPPAVPLMVFDPFMNIWSMSDHLYDSFP